MNDQAMDDDTTVFCYVPLDFFLPLFCLDYSIKFENESVLKNLDDVSRVIVHMKIWKSFRKTVVNLG